MYSTQFLSLPQMVKSAQAPWDFWYPPAVSNLIMAELAKPSGAAASAITGAFCKGLGSEEVSQIILALLALWISARLRRRRSSSSALV